MQTYGDFDVVPQAFCGSCTFEDISSPDCGYEDVSTGIFRWESVQAGSGQDSSPPPPAVDHSTNSSDGHYMFLDHSDNLFGETALLTGPRMGKTTALCALQLWYHMTGERSQVLTVYSMVSTSH
jgi:hypothetical protein